MIGYQISDILKLLKHKVTSLNFHLFLCRYLSIVQDEGLEVSQPALDLVKSTVYHPITARQRGSRVHRLVLVSRTF